MDVSPSANLAQSRYTRKWPSSVEVELRERGRGRHTAYLRRGYFIALDAQNVSDRYLLRCRDTRRGVRFVHFVARGRAHPWARFAIVSVVQPTRRHNAASLYT